MLSSNRVLAFVLLISVIHMSKSRLVTKNGVTYFDQDCRKPTCPSPQRLVCPNRADACSCYCQDVPCYMPQCGSDCQVSCLRRTGWCQCKCVPRNQRCADTWSSTCLAVCVGCNPCKCNCGKHLYAYWIQ
ncbi:uncharacterized protein LOC119459509 [Dermacentor silvarum]|uniref:uncharacterized protein LOC119459509 n=1 Tax=Dermacentor silvarum TaxID=543639 RepID=UPI002100A32E|nr:uncharacterized protein LOC119459509 [Dermacentor silvarum]